MTRGFAGACCAALAATAAAAVPTLLETGEAALARGDTDAALQALDAASRGTHAAAVELALVHARMQAGEYRRALAFAAHVAGEHLDEPAPAALYAWLLAAGGQRKAAQAVIDDAVRRRPADVDLAAVQDRLAHAPAPTRPAWRDAPLRLAPVALGPLLPATARVTASGALVDDGRRALVPLAAADRVGRFWLRNGLGRTAAARFERALPDLGFALLVLDEPLDAVAAWSTREPYAGSPGYAAAFVPADDAAPAWPWLVSGFFGGGDGPQRRLGLPLATGSGVAPVLDAAGRLAGIALAPVDGAARLVPASALRDMLPSAAATTPGTAPITTDAAYERLLRLTVQLIAAPG